MGAAVQLKRASSLDDLDRIARPILAELGFFSVAAARFFTVGHTAGEKLLFGQLDSGWAERYVAGGYVQKCRIAREMLVSDLPYSWSEVIRRRGLDRATGTIWNHARELGFTDGLHSPIRTADGGYGAVILCGTEAGLGDPFIRSAAEVLAAYYGSEGLRLLDLNRTARPLLSRRQRECLAWVRHGKSSADIGSILGLSVPTVDGHIAEACRKLGVRTRIQAAVEASLAGLIDG
ncbi:MAG TPA: autoinducer binding domain-containing protein [Allosphingosinicella sp.]